MLLNWKTSNTKSSHLKKRTLAKAMCGTALNMWLSVQTGLWWAFMYLWYVRKNMHLRRRGLPQCLQKGNSRSWNFTIDQKTELSSMTESKRRWDRRGASWTEHLKVSIVITSRRQAVWSGGPPFKSFIPKQYSAFIRQNTQAVFVSIV